MSDDAIDVALGPYPKVKTSTQFLARIFMCEDCGLASISFLDWYGTLLTSILVVMWFVEVGCGDVGIYNSG